MWLIVGLGNPGPKYEWTRHNCGFLVIDELARRAQREVRTPECQALTARVTIDGKQALLAKPQTFMNLSGAAVAGLKQKHEVADATQVLIISDDLALPFGKLRIRPKGSAGGQNGLKSIIAKLGTQDFPRIRLGIAPEHPIGNASDFVLGEFPKKDRDTLAEQVAQAADAVEVLLTKGIAEAMSKYN
ncbi:MAG TPA: aminoacyl-tRNA hydrolase [Blastocatellia bacterium]|nr:aminoacyl-tRNA hydrolase [Blastocatellia bacterium]HMV83106.1 aminoacyl-tRNA hydrolase [Blastocatellia bacterium]HMX26477.1 aminoacyl-tRNA hydrolase [Blastocatellia bacterium]HMY73101.1 aminoacyl-tRNA hydrolase [Blastocatellia bacterium]HNG31003.1 aminoacyl-tRNA hydrolase [Blastocatellia bacterium]